MAPRLSASPRKNTKLRVVPTGAPSVPPASVGHNSDHGEEAERVQLISIVSQLSAAEDAIEVAKGPLKAAQKKRSQIIGLGKAAGFTAKELQRRLDEMNTGTRENAALEQRERKHRRWLGIIEPDQASLILGDAAPQSAKDEAHWRGEGFKAGLRQMAGKPPPECPAREVQAWMEEHARGLQMVLTANAPKASTASVRDQAAADFAADNKPEPGSPEAAAAERKAIRAAKAGLEKMAEREPVGEIVDTDPLGIGQMPADLDAGFEATAEELAAQAPRQAVQEAKAAADDDGTAHPCPDCGAAAGVPCEPDCPSEAVDPV